MSEHIKIFTNIYENCIWANNNNKNYKGGSGGGSELNYNIINYIPFLKSFIINNNINTIIDLGCGDFTCGKHIYENIENIKYYGYDAYEKVIEENKNNFNEPKYNFKHLDILNDKKLIIEGDLCILKDILQHWSNKDIYSFLDYLYENKKYKYILLVNCCNQVADDQDINTGEGRPLSCNYFPLKKYNPEKIMNYNTKEVSLIRI